MLSTHKVLPYGEPSIRFPACEYSIQYVATSIDVSEYKARWNTAKTSHNFKLLWETRTQDHGILKWKVNL